MRQACVSPRIFQKEAIFTFQSLCLWFLCCASLFCCWGNEYVQSDIFARQSYFWLFFGAEGKSTVDDCHAFDASIHFDDKCDRVWSYPGHALLPAVVYLRTEAYPDISSTLCVSTSVDKSMACIIEFRSEESRERKGFHLVTKCSGFFFHKNWLTCLRIHLSILPFIALVPCF